MFVCMWGFAPSEFWRCTPAEWWRIYAGKKPYEPGDGLSDEDLDRLSAMLEAEKNEGG